MYYPLNDNRIALAIRTSAADAALAYVNAIAAHRAAIINRASMHARLDAAERVNTANTAMVAAYAELASAVPAADFAGSGPMGY